MNHPRFKSPEGLGWQHPTNIQNSLIFGETVMQCMHSTSTSNFTRFSELSTVKQLLSSAVQRIDMTNHTIHIYGR